MEMGLASLLLPIVMCWMMGGKLGSLDSAIKHYQILLSRLTADDKDAPHFMSKKTILENLEAISETKHQWVNVGIIFAIWLFLTVAAAVIGVIADNEAKVTSSALYPWGLVVGLLVYVAACVALFRGSYRHYYQKESDRLAMMSTR